MAGGNLFKIEKAEIHHLKQVKKIELECGLSDWSPADYRQEIGRIDSFFRICLINNKIVGFILARLIMYKLNPSQINETKKLLSNNDIITNHSENVLENEAEIYNIGISKKYRRLGLGTILFQDLLEKSKQSNTKKIWLEVRISNKDAIVFYQSKGFKIIGTRKCLYTNPAEDGFVMRLDV
ncbi:ribosomal protein S18-alanine N-acetyltransferase [soil metagenome]